MVVQITVTGGKGGTGKSFVAVNLAVLYSVDRDTILADLDLEAPNDHILLGVPRLENEEPIKLFLPFIDYKTCTNCGVCAKICDTGAILMPPKGFPIVFPRLCSGCMACYYACPYKAIRKGWHVLGYSYVTKVEISGHSFTLVTGVLREGEEHVPPGISIVKNRALKIAKDVIIVDTGAGTGNSISMAIQSSRLVLIVTEPTPLGLHDLEAILKIVNNMGYRSWVVINRFGLGDHSKHVKLAKDYGVEYIHKIPYHMDAVESYVKQKPVVVYRPSSPVSRSFKELYYLLKDLK